MKPVPQSMVKMHVGRFELFDIASDSDVLGKLLAIKFTLAGIYTTDELLKLFFDLIFDAIPATRGAIFLIGRNPEKFEFMTYRDESFEVDMDLAAQALRHSDAFMSTEGASFLYAPLRVFQRKYGVAYLDHPEPGALTMNHLRLFIAAASIAAVTLEQTLNSDRLESENQLLHEEIDRQYGIVGESACMAEVFQIIRKVSATDSTVLIGGESGTGKELAARAIHRSSARRQRPFVEVNCAAIMPTLIESELFGHEKGAFTGADTQKIGKIEAANGGTIFLDEIGELTPAAQAAMLRVLQEQEFQRVGGTRTVQVDVRVISATNRNLKERVQEGSFRLDLYYRLNVIELHMPSLAQRRGDIPILTDHFLQKFRCVRVVSGVTPKARRLLAAYSWPGNVRELQNTIERALVLGSSKFIQPEDLPAELQPKIPADVSNDGLNAKDFEFKVKLIERTLVETGGNVAKASRILKLSKSYVHRLIRQGIVKRP
jgi:Nif-specific regulatory protein